MRSRAQFRNRASDIRRRRLADRPKLSEIRMFSDVIRKCPKFGCYSASASLSRARDIHESEERKQHTRKRHRAIGTASALASVVLAALAVEIGLLCAQPALFAQHDLLDAPVRLPALIGIERTRGGVEQTVDLAFPLRRRGGLARLPDV